jgi:hypothetical protein
MIHNKVSSLSTLLIDYAYKMLRYKTAFQGMLEVRQKNRVDLKVKKVNTRMNAKSTFTKEEQDQ